MYSNKTVLLLSRIIVGILFIFSGLIKANDPAGLSFKMQEFFEVWGWHGLDQYTLLLSIFMISFEIIAGSAVIVGWRFPFFSWMLLLLIFFFTFLTGYAVLSEKIRECGCFGDCIKLTAEQSFIKDLVLMFMIFYLVRNRKNVRPVLPGNYSVMLIGFCMIVSFLIQFHVLAHLPIVDCLPYRKGNNIIEKMKIPADAVPDSIVIQFVYLKDGQEIEFDADHFPSDFNDTSYQFVRRYDKLIRKGNAVPPISDFVIISPTGADTTLQILQEPRLLVLFARMLPRDPMRWAWANDLAKINASARKLGIPVIWVTSETDNLVKGLKARGLSDIPVMQGDAVAIKTAARAEPAIYMLEAGTIFGKWSYADFDHVPFFLQRYK